MEADQFSLLECELQIEAVQKGSDNSKTACSAEWHGNLLTRCVF